MRTTLLVSVALMIFAAGCVHRDNVIGDTPPGEDADTLTMLTDGAAPPPDASPALPDQGTAGALHAVVSKVVAPVTTAQITHYSVDLDNDGHPDNRLFYAFQSVLTIVPKPEPWYLQGFFDLQLKGGQRLPLLELAGGALTSHLGQDTDGDPTNNFSGTATLGIKASGVPLKATVKGGKLSAGPGAWAFHLPLGEAQPTRLTLKLARVRATFSKGKLAGVAMAGAMPATELEQKLLPGVAAFLDHAYKDPGTDAVTKKFIGENLDADQDGTLSVKELKPLLDMLITPDLDTDGDGKADAVSMGFGVETVPCVIKKP